MNKLAFFFATDFVHSCAIPVLWLGEKCPRLGNTSIFCSSLFEGSNSSMKWLGVYKGLEKITSF